MRTIVVWASGLHSQNKVQAGSLHHYVTLSVQSSARNHWLNEVKYAVEARAAREESDFLANANQKGEVTLSKP
jgi:hypothetical protein